MSETLEELKAIIAGKKEGDMFYCDGQYLDHRLNVRTEHTKYAINGTTYYFNYQQPVSVMMNKLRSLSDIERIIELEEKLRSFADDIGDCDCIGGVAKTLREYGL